MTVFTDQEVADGLVRLGRSPDAKFLRQLLVQVLVAVPAETLSDGALRHFEGRRNLARTLITVCNLNADAAEKAGTIDDAAHLVRSPSGTVRPGATRGLERRVPAVAAQPDKPRSPGGR